MVRHRPRKLPSFRRDVVRVQTQGEKRQAGGFKRDLAASRKERPAAPRELAANESPLEGNEKRVLITHRTLLRQSDTNRQKSAVLAAPCNTHLRVVCSGMRSRRDLFSKHFRTGAAAQGGVEGAALDRSQRARACDLLVNSEVQSCWL